MAELTLCLCPFDLSISSHFVQMWFYLAIYAHFAEFFFFCSCCCCCCCCCLNRLLVLRSHRECIGKFRANFICIIQIVCKLRLYDGYNRHIIWCRHHALHESASSTYTVASPTNNCMNVLILFFCVLFFLRIFSLSCLFMLVFEWSANNCYFHRVRYTILWCSIWMHKKEQLEKLGHFGTNTIRTIGK